MSWTLDGPTSSWRKLLRQRWHHDELPKFHFITCDFGSLGFRVQNGSQKFGERYRGGGGPPWQEIILKNQHFVDQQNVRSKFCWSTIFFVDQHSGGFPYWRFCWSIKFWYTFLLINKIFIFFVDQHFGKFGQWLMHLSFVSWLLKIIQYFPQFPMWSCVFFCCAVALWGLFSDDCRLAWDWISAVLAISQGYLRRDCNPPGGKPIEYEFHGSDNT